jgi:hypothetical protein
MEAEIRQRLVNQRETLDKLKEEISWRQNLIEQTQVEIYRRKEAFLRLEGGIIVCEELLKPTGPAPEAPKAETPPVEVQPPETAAAETERETEN